MVRPPKLPSGDGPDDDGPDDERPDTRAGFDVEPDRVQRAQAEPPSLIIDLTDVGPEQARAVGAVRRASVADLPATAAIHAGQLPGGFFVRFGRRFLAAYHERFLAGPAATMLVTGPVGAPTGFLVGTFDNAAHYRWLVRHPGSLLRVGAGSLLARPRLAVELLRTRAGRYLRVVGRLTLRRWAPAPRTAHSPQRATAGSVDPRIVAVLTHVAVAPHARGAGLGRRLVATFVQQAGRWGAEEVRLISHVGTGAPSFYRRLGWTSLGERRASDGTLVEEFQLFL